jgi:hypothetical protein
MTANPGWGNRKPMQYGESYPKMANCPDCDGRGWFLINPFATGGSNGAGGIGNMSPCETCRRSEEYWRQHKCLPPDVVESIIARQVAAIRKESPEATSVAITERINKLPGLAVTLGQVQKAIGFKE